MAAFRRKRATPNPHSEFRMGNLSRPAWRDGRELFSGIQLAETNDKQNLLSLFAEKYFCFLQINLRLVSVFVQ